MNRTSSLLRRTPMSRSSKAMKRKTRKQIAGHHDKRYLEACRGEPCYLQLPGCRSYEGDPTVVPAHANGAAYGKGMGLKARDEYTVPACFYCHAELDQGFSLTKAEKAAYWDWAYTRWEGVRARKMGVADDQA